jgi:hypothetical protein
LLEKITESPMGLEQRIDPLAQFAVTAAHPVQKCGAFTYGQLDGRGKYLEIRLGNVVHTLMRGLDFRRTAAFAQFMGNWPVKTNEIAPPKGQPRLRYHRPANVVAPKIVKVVLPAAASNGRRAKAARMRTLRND